MGVSREDALKIWLPIIRMGVENMPECKESLDMAIASLKTDEAYQLMHEGGEVFTKADMVAMLTEIQLEIEEIEMPLCHSATNAKGCVDRGRIEGLIQQKINALKGDEE